MPVQENERKFAENVTLGNVKQSEKLLPFLNRGEDKVAVTVAEKNVSVLNDIMQKSVGRTVNRSKQKQSDEKYETVNSDYYVTLSPEQRSTQVETNDVANAVMKELEKANILYSAVVRKNDTVAVTVAKENAPAYKKISEDVKKNRAVQKVQKSEKKAEKSASQKAQNARNTGKKACFSRNQLKNEVQRINNQGKQNQQKNTDKNLDK